MAKAFKSSEGMTKVSDNVTPVGVNMNADKNWVMIVWRFDKELAEMKNVPKKISDLWKANMARY